MPFRSKFCYISNSSYIYIAVPGVPLSDVSADDESGFFLFTNLISFAAAKIRIGRGSHCRYDHCRRNFSLLHRFTSLDLKSRITAAPRAFPGKPCGDSQVYPLKSGIAARRRSQTGIILQRFPSLSPEITNRCTPEGNPGHSLQRFSSLTPEIRNHCSPGVVSGKILQRFPSLPPEIQNHCSPGVVPEEKDVELIHFSGAVPPR